MGREKSVQEKDIMEILSEIRDARNAELKAQEKTNISVVMVELLGEGEKTDRKFFTVYEQNINKPGQRTEQYYVYDGDKAQRIARKMETGKIMPLDIQWEKESQYIDECIKVRQREYEQELKMMAKELGIKEEKIANLSVEELAKKVEETENSGEQGRKQKKQQGDDSQRLTEEQVNNIGGVRNEVQLDIPVDSRGTLLRDVLKLEGFTSIMPVPSSKLQSLATKGEDTENPRVPFVLVGRRQDGTIATLPTDRVKLYRGSNTEATKINNTDSVEHSADEDCIFEVVGSNNRLIVNQTDPYGIPNVYLGQATRTNDGNVAQKLQDRYDGTERTDVEVRQLFNANKGRDQIQEMENEADTHFENGNCPASEEERIEGNNAVKTVDGDRDTGHQHSEEQHLEDGTVIVGISPELIKLIAERCKVSEKAAAEYAKQISEENNTEEMTEEEIIDEAQEIDAKNYDPRATSRTRNI